MFDKDIDDIRLSVERIESILKRRWLLFSVIFAAMVLCLIVVYVELNTIRRIEIVTNQADSRSIRNEAAIDASVKQMLVYQQQTVQRWDALSKWNPRVKVPKAVVPPPVASPAETPAVLSDEELKRNPDPKQPTVSTVVKHKPRPT